MSALHSMPTLRTLADLQDELGRLRADFRKINLVLAFLAGYTHRAMTNFARQRTVDGNCLIDLLGNRPASALAVLRSGLSARRLGVALRFSLCERTGLPLAATSQLFDDLFQLSDPAFLLLDEALLLGDLLSELRVLLKDFLVSRHF